MYFSFNFLPFMFLASWTSSASFFLKLGKLYFETNMEDLHKTALKIKNIINTCNIHNPSSSLLFLVFLSSFPLLPFFLIFFSFTILLSTDTLTQVQCPPNKTSRLIFGASMNKLLSKFHSIYRWGNSNVVIRDVTIGIRELTARKWVQANNLIQMSWLHSPRTRGRIEQTTSSSSWPAPHLPQPPPGRSRKNPHPIPSRTSRFSPAPWAGTGPRPRRTQGMRPSAWLN